MPRVWEQEPPPLSRSVLPLLATRGNLTDTWGGPRDPKPFWWQGGMCLLQPGTSLRQNWDTLRASCSERPEAGWFQPQLLPSDQLQLQKQPSWKE